jgi:hypothetical protein
VDASLTGHEQQEWGPQLEESLCYG